MPGVVEEQSRHFIAQLSVTQGSRPVGLTAIGGIFPALKDITVLMVHRGEHATVPPYENLVLEAGDLVIVAPPRPAPAAPAHGPRELPTTERLARDSPGRDRAKADNPRRPAK